MGICTTNGPRQPMGLTPASRYMRMVSWETRARSLRYLSWISRILGCRVLMARICRTCFRVSGSVTTRTRTVSRMMAMPIWLKLITYNTIRVLSIGRMIASFQITVRASKKTYSLAVSHWTSAFLVSRHQCVRMNACPAWLAPISMRVTVLS